ncbi:non-ribosomal peptide synthetase [Nocardia alba]|uniref:Non-ribosomal peptide synthase protein (TIGR01720 family)/amino acid adenylation domain-containing protein n=1 Tax=Nocardia alba TaxID=225051 RepID=A0A4V2PBC0_9NOCA|nr:non-ribosomal peptide synthetase [Nocardia alba]TCJ96815.1 non-ribosomal peptide synthase protein (TIGR01720 family)/amino acid adenylation domain-containing protein [Nocardia alba]
MREARTSPREVRRAPRGRGNRKSSTPLFTQLLTAAVDIAGDVVAVSATSVDGERRELTYTQLDEYSSQLARDLIGRGIGPGDLVALGFTRSIESVAAVWAVAKTGAAYVPVDPALPAERIAFLLADSGAILGLTGTAHREKLGDSVEWFELDAPAQHERVTAHPAYPISYLDRVRPLTDQHPAYVIYTSGSTGRPKGVVVTHTGLGGLVAAARERYSVDEGDRVLHVCSPNFDVSVLELLVTFNAGATLVVAPSTVFGGPELAELLRREGVTHLLITPAALESVDAHGLESLSVVVVAGDAFGPTLVERWAVDRAFFNGYGPTEATILATGTTDLRPGQPITIGTAFAGVGATVLDSRLRPVPAGVVGELYLFGPALAQSYRGRPALTAERFVASPFTDSRMYRTGDLVRRTVDGDFEYLGRSDFQVKIRGFRVELGEIDAALTAHPDIDYAVTLGTKADSGATVLVSYVLARQGVSIDTDAVVRFVSTSLPGHMVPTVVMILDEIPLTSNGKLDRNALPAPVFGAVGSRAPEGPVEVALAELFTQILGVERIGAEDSFFAAGGDSILSIQLVSRARNAGISFTPQAVFEHRTVAGLARVAVLGAESAPTLAELPGGGVGEVPLTPVLAASLAGGRVFGRFTQQMVLALPDGIDRHGLVDALTAVIDHHDMLRSGLRQVDGRWELHTLAPGAVDVGELLVRVDVAAGTAGLGEVADAAMDAVLASLDPLAYRMIGFAWLARADGPDGLVVAANHAVIDGVSWRILLSDLVAAWAQAGRRVVLPPVGTSFRRWAHGLTDAATGRRAELDYWRRTLAVPDPLLGARRLDSRDTASTVRTISVEVSVDITQAILTDLPARYRGGAEDGLLAALAMATRMWRDRRGVDAPATRVRLEGHGREQSAVDGADLTRTVGWFTSMYPVALDLSEVEGDAAWHGGHAAAAVVKAVKEQLRAVPDRGIGFGMLRHLDPESAPRLDGTLGQIGFNYLGRITAGDADHSWLPTAGWGEPVAEQDPDLPAAAVVDINALAVSGEAGLTLRASFSYAAGIIDEASVRELAECWTAALAILAEHLRDPAAGGLSPSDVPLVQVTQAELDSWHRERPQLTDVVPLAPLQLGLLFLAQVSAADPYLVQLAVELTGAVDSDRLRRAAQAVLDRHAILRTAFGSSAAGTPVGFVAEGVTVPWQIVDTECADADEFLTAQAKVGFELSVAPLLRFTLYRRAEGMHLVLTAHHLLVDGWSMPLLMRELLLCYATDGAPVALPQARPYRDYLAWLARQDRSAALRGWRAAMAGHTPTLLTAALAPPTAQVEGHGMCTVELSPGEAAELAACAAANDVTVNTLFQAAWGVVLAGAFGHDDVVFGAVVSGRPPQLDGVDEMVGLFANTVPVRVRFHGSAPLRNMLSQLQAEQIAVLDGHHLGLAEIQRAAGTGELFDTLMAYESYPVDTEGMRHAQSSLDGLEIVGVRAANATHYPVAVGVEVGEGIRVGVQYRRDLVDAGIAQALTDRLRATLDAFLRAPDQTAAQLLDRLDRSDDVIAQASYWRSVLADLPAQLHLPADRARPASPVSADARVRFEIPAELHCRMRDFADSRDTTVFSLVHAVFAVLLARLADTEDVAIDTPCPLSPAARLVLRLPVRRATSVEALLAEASTVARRAFARTGLPEEISSTRAVGETSRPLRVALMSEECSTVAAVERDLVLSLRARVDGDDRRSGAAADHQLSFVAAGRTVNDDPAGAIAAEFVYASALFDRATVDVFAQRLLRLLTAALEHPESAVGDLTILSTEEHATLTARTADTDTALLPDLIARGNALGPDRIAVRHEGRSITYGELTERTARWARVLIAHGVGPEVAVAVALPRSYDMVAAALAIAAAGGTYVPMDPRNPAHRLRHLVCDSGAILGITAAAHLEDLPDELTWLTVDDLDRAGTTHPSTPITDADRVSPLRIEHPAYLIYTSGSTGLPKGVTVTHTGLAPLVEEAVRRYRLESEHRFLHICAPWFDPSVLEWLCAFSTGATLVVVAAEIAGGIDLADLLAAESVTHAIITPAVLGTLDPAGLRALASVSVGGDVTTAELLATWQPGRRYLNGYGPTETTIISSYAELTVGQPITIGTPVPGTHAMILDARLHPVAPGVTGELYLTGRALARGYRDQPTTTSARFVADPWGAPGARMYRTGDLVRLRATGDLDYRGRVDSQLKVRGFRIEPGEVDAVLVAHPDVEFAVTVGRPGPTGSTTLVSYVLAAQGHAADPHALTVYAGERLAAHAVPSAIVVLDALPLTSNGKLDRNALPEPVLTIAPAAAPTGARQTLLAELFARVLGVAQVGAHDSFFAIGGDSILSIQLVSLARAAGLVFTTRDVFEHRTVAKLSDIAALDSPGSPVLAELPGGGLGDVALTPVLADFLTTGSSDRFAQTMVLALPDDIDRAGLLATLAAVLRHHDMLRARLHRDSDDWQLEVLAPHTVDVDCLLTEIDSAAAITSDELTRIGTAAMDSALAALDPAAARMIAFTWIRRHGARDVLAVAAHHYVIDGVSWRILLPDLVVAWSQHVAGRPIALPPVGTSFRRWAHGLAAADRSAELDHWRAALATPDPLLGARAIDSRLDTEASMRSITVQIPAEVTEPLLTTLPAQYRAGTDHALLAALALAVRVWRARRGVDATTLRLRLEGHGRQEDAVPGADLTRTVGWFTTVYPVVVDLGAITPAVFDDQALAATMRTVKEQLRAVPDHGIGFGVLRRNPDTRNLLSGSIGQIGFNYLGRATTAAEPTGDTAWLPTADLGDIEVEYDPDLPAHTVLDINVIAVSTDTGLRLRADFRYATGILSESEVEELADDWTGWLTALAEHTHHPCAGGLTPSDVALVRVSQNDLNTWRTTHPGLSDVLPLSPLQHSLLALGDMLDESVHAYVIQLMAELTGELDTDRLRRAAATVLHRHANLRAAFVTTPDGTPVQLVCDIVEAPFHLVETTDAELPALLAADQRAGFDPAIAPLLRFTVYTTGSGHSHLVLTGHHILVDGWSMPLLMKELLVLYATHGDASALAPVRPYRDYLEWLTRQDRTVAERAWSRMLDGVTPTMLAPELTWPPATDHGYGLCEFELDTARTHTLTAFAAAAEVTANTVFQTAWGLVVAASTARDDVVFGATVSGRPPQLDGVGDMIGLFVDAVPVRVRLDPAATVGALIRAVQTEQASLLDHHHLGLGAIQRVAGLGELFDTMLAFESYPVDVEGLQQAGGALDNLSIDDLRGADHTHYPVTVLVFLGARTQVQIKYRRDLVSESVARALTDRLRSAIDSLIATPSTPVASIVDQLAGDPADPITRSRFWRRTLADLPARLALPTDHFVPQSDDLVGACPDRARSGHADSGIEAKRGRVRSTIPATVARDLHELADTVNVSRQSLIRTAVAVLLARLTASDDIVVTTYAPDLLLRSEIDLAVPVLELLTRAHQAQTLALAHAGIPLADFAVLLGVEPRALGQVSVQLRSDVGLSQDPVPATAKTEAVSRPDEDAELSVTVVETTSRTAIEISFARTVFDDNAADTFVRRLVRLLTAIAADPRTPAGDLPLSDHAEYTFLTHLGDGTTPPTTTTLPELLMRGTGYGQHRIAVRDKTNTYTYGTLDADSARLARVLIAEGIGPETVVASAIPRSYASILAFWAIAKAGGVYLPVDPNYPEDRVRHMLTDSGATIGLTVGAQANVLPGSLRWLSLDDPAVRARIAAGSSTPVRDRDRRAPLRGDNIAYVIYTSGSTGTPKGVSVTHAGLGALITHSAALMRLRHDHRMLHVCSPSFDQSIEELATAFHRGATLVIAPPDTLGGADLDDLLRTEQVTHTIITPALLGTLDPTALPDLRCVSAGGEATTAELLAAWQPGRSFLNGYGPTETTIGATYSTLRAGDRVTIGRPVPGLRAVVLDARLHPVPVGATGELYLAGPALARGYRGRAAATADRFVACPWADLGTRMYRTGDLVRWVHGDTYELEYLGRTDFQIKIRGFRIEPGEIDAVLSRHPQVSFALTLGARNPAGDTVLVSYVMGRQLDPAAITRWSASVLPAHMVPSAVVVVDHVPLSAAGKIDRNALPAPEFATRTYREPAAGLERTVAAVFAEVLGAERVGADDNFFDLGGNSLLATRLTARIGAAVDIRVPVRVLFAAPTVAECAREIAGLARAARRPALRASPRPARIPLSPAQQRMWFLNRFDAATAAYTIPVVLRLTGALDTEAMVRAFTDLVARHEILRTIYPTVDQTPAQIVLPVEHPELPRLNVTAVAREHLTTVVTELVSTVFDVTREVPLRATLFEVGPDEHVLAMAVHHIAGDGFSGGPLTRDLVVAYTARAQQQPPAWAPLPVQYADYAIWQHTLLGDDTDPTSMAAAQLTYWQHALAELPDQLELPRDRPRPAIQSAAGGRVPFTLDTATHAAMAELARTHGATLFMAVHTALAVVLAELSGTTDIAIGTPVAGRGDAALDDLIGMFVNTLVLRTRVDAGASFAEQLIRQRDTDLAAFANADIPFERLVEVLNPARSTARHPLFQVGLSFQNLAQAPMDLPGMSVASVELDRELSQFDLHLILADRYTAQGSPAGITGYCTFATDLFDAATVEGFLARLTRLITTVITDPGAPLHTVDLLAPAERAQILDTWNHTARQTDPGATLASLFDATVSRTPDALALVADDIGLTYAALDERVNRLARYLIAAGVGPETRVALAMARSIDLVVAMYAVSVAGGAYVPIDPDHPRSRTDHILDTAAPLLVLTDADAWLGADRATPDVRHIEQIDLDGYSPAPITDRDRRAPLRPADTAYVIFTSGSTGRPKGVAVSHTAIVNQLRWKKTEFGLTAQDVVLLKTAATFDLSVWEFWSAAICGGRLVLAARDGHRDPAYLAELMRREEVTTLHVVPSMLDLLVTEGLPSSLRRVLAIGETLPVALARRFTTAAPHTALFNVYGPTEAAVSITGHRVRDTDASTVAIGSPVWNSQVYVLDARLRPVPVGVPGELYLAGVQLATGYLARPDLTAERFVANPFHAGTRLYRTGDLAAWRADGELEYRGRTDFQLKIRGFRIELEEIDAVLGAHPDVGFAVTVGRENQAGETVLVSYVVAAHGHDVDVDSLTQWATRALPAHMVATTMMVLDEVPLTHTGKLDRAALPAPELLTRAYRAPDTAIEHTVAGIFADVLRLDSVGMDDHFFELGGTSLSATRLSAQLSTATAATVPVTWIFTTPTPAGIVAALRAEGTDSAGTDAAYDILLPLRTEGTGAPLFCVHPISGIAWSFSGLAAHLDRPLYGLQSPALSSTEPLPDSIEQWALRYLKEIRAVQAEGPYHLLGWSLGGVIAHAMAVQLQEDGEEVAMLAMLDSTLSSAATAVATTVSAADLLGGFVGTDEVDLAQPIDVHRLARTLVELSAPGTSVDPARVDRIVDAAITSVALDAAYSPRRFDGTITYFTASQDDPTGTTTASSWSAVVTGAVDNHQVDATHWRMTEDHALAVIAATLRKELG